MPGENHDLTARWRPDRHKAAALLLNKFGDCLFTHAERKPGCQTLTGVKGAFTFNFGF